MLRNVNSVEYSEGIFVGLFVLCLGQVAGSCVSEALCFGSGTESGLLSHDVVGFREVNSVELVDCLGRNWLLNKFINETNYLLIGVLFTLYSHELSSGLKLAVCMLNKL